MVPVAENRTKVLETRLAILRAFRSGPIGPRELWIRLGSQPKIQLQHLLEEKLVSQPKARGPYEITESGRAYLNNKGALNGHS